MTSPYAGRSFIFDLETNGLLAEVSRVHCAVAIDIETEEVLDFKPNEIGKFLELYIHAKRLIGHNAIGYDCAVIQKLYGLPIPSADRLIDTMNLARLVFADIKDDDYRKAKRWKAYQTQKTLWERQERPRLLQRQLEQVANASGLCIDELSSDVVEKIEVELVIGEPPIAKPKEFPGFLAGSHSLEAWGYRLGTEKKGDYSKECKAKGIDPWASWNQDMHDYMIQDGKVTLALWKHLMAEEPTWQSILLETRVQLLCSQMERNGWPFDIDKAQRLYVELCAERDQLAHDLRSLFPPWTVQLDDFIPKRNNKTKGYIAGVAVPRFETIEFNPSSRAHIADRLKDKYGWEPAEYTAGGSPKIDDDVLQALPYPEAKDLARYFLVQKRIGQIGEGAQAWLKAVTKEGRIHGRYNTNGAPTGRAAHSNPNVAQVPRVGSPYGEECRELFTVPKGWRQLGADQAGLELRCLGSYIAAFDGGAYIEVVLHGDVHWENAKALMGWADDLALDPHNAAHKAARNLAKTFIYAFLYGAGDEKLGSIAGVTDEEAEAWKADPKHAKAILALLRSLAMRHIPFEDRRSFKDAPNELVFKVAKSHGWVRPSKKALRLTYKGSLLREAFLSKFPALAELIKVVKKAAKKKWLKGLDGRKIPVRSEHAALNSLLQSAGALICKQWIVDAEQALIDAGLKHGWDGDFVFLGWIHDELQIAVREGLEAKVEALIVEAARKAGDPFPAWRCPTDGDCKVGSNWAECH